MNRETEMEFSCGHCPSMTVGFVGRDETIKTFGTYVKTVPLANLKSDVRTVVCLDEHNRPVAGGKGMSIKRFFEEMERNKTT